MTRPTFITLGPAGTCHENALQHYLRFQGVTPHEVVLVEDLLAAIGRGPRGAEHVPRAVQRTCAGAPRDRALPRGGLRRSRSGSLGLVFRNDVEEHKSLGIVSATRGYLDLSRFETIVDQPS
jgi:hypothetical protein